MPQPTDIKQPVEELVIFLKDLLEPYGFRLGTDLSLKVAQLFEFFKVTTIADVLKLSSKLAPVIVKNETEQKLFYQVIRNYEKGMAAETESGEGINIDIELYKIRINVKKPTFLSWLATLAVIGLIAIILFASHFITLYTNDNLSPKFEILQKGAINIGQDVQFQNTTLIDLTKSKKDKQSVFTWKFDDSVIRSDKKLLTYRFLESGNHTISLSVNDSTTTQFLRIYETCALFPDFTIYLETSRLDSSVVYIRNATLANKGCIKAYYIDFGDSSRHTIGTSFDTIRHSYKRPGDYTIQLTAYNFTGKAYSINKGIGFGRANLVYRGQLPNIPPQTVLQKYPSKGNLLNYSMLIYFAAILITSIIAAIFFLIITLYKRKKLKPIKQKFDLGKKRTGASNYMVTTDTSGVAFEDRKQIFDGRLSGVQRTNAGKIDIYATIYSTIRKAGFPQINYFIPKRKQDYIFLIDTGKGNNQQVALFELLIKRGAVSGTDYKIYYYSHDPLYLSDNETMNGPFHITNLVKDQQDANLIIMGDGYGFLPTTNQYIDLDQGHLYPSVLKKWARKALITPVPRSNWSRNERALYNLLPIYPATSAGLELVHEAMRLPRHRQQLPSREDAEPYMFYPLTNDIAEYERFFLEDQRLLIWLYALALADNPNWVATIVAGNALQEKYFKNDTPLVTYSNLLKLTAVEWMQTGQLSVAHRQEMMDQLRKEPDSQKIIRITAQALLQLSAQEKVEKGTLNETQKNIKEEILQQWTTEDPLLSVSYLSKNKLIDTFNSKELQKEKRIKQGNTFFNFLKSYTGTIFIILIIAGLFLHFKAAKSRLAQDLFSAVLKTDSFIYYNNIACKAMDRYDTTMGGNYSPFLLNISSPDSRIQPLKAGNPNMINPDFLYARASFFLNKAAGFPNKDTTVLEQNRKTLYYTVAKSYYDDLTYKSAINFFNRIIGVDTIGLNALHGKAICFLKLNNTDSACSTFKRLDKAGFAHPSVPIDCSPRNQTQQAIKPVNNQPTRSSQYKPVRNTARRGSIIRPALAPYTATNYHETTVGEKALANAKAELKAGARAYTIDSNRYMGPFVTKYNAIANIPAGIPWACTFVSWCFNKDTIYFKPMVNTQALEDVFNRSSITFSLEDAILPEAGDIYFYDWDNYQQTSTYRAIGIVSSYDANKQVLKGIEGNSNDSMGQNYKVAAVAFNLSGEDTLNFRFARVSGEGSVRQNDSTYSTTKDTASDMPLTVSIKSTRNLFPYIASLVPLSFIVIFLIWRRRKKTS